MSNFYLQVLYYRQAGTHPLTLLHIELEGERAESTKPRIVPTNFSTPHAGSGNGRRNSRSPLSPRGGASSMPSSSTTRPQSQNRTTTTTNTTAQDSDSTFDFASLCSALPEINTRFERVEQRLDNAENNINVMKTKLGFFHRKIVAFSGRFDTLQEDVDASKTRVKKVENRMNYLNIVNKS